MLAIVHFGLLGACLLGCLTIACGLIFEDGYVERLCVA